MADATSDIRGFNTPSEIETKDNTARIVGAAVIVLALASAGAYSFEKGMWRSAPKQAVSTSELPSPTPPQAAQNVAPLPAAVNTTPAPQAAPVAAPAAAPVVTTTNTTIQTPTKTVRTHVVSHETTAVRRSDVIHKHSTPDQNYVAPSTGNSAVTPETPNDTSTPNSNMTPQSTNPVPSTTAPSTTTPSQTVAPQQNTAPAQTTTQTTTPNQSPPNNSDQSTTPQPQ
jgi:hypothetical protein